MLRDDIPKQFYLLKQVKDIIDAIQPEIDLINEQIQKLKLDIFLSTTSIIERFELDYGIEPDDSKSNEDRILAVINKKNLYQTFTDTRLRELIKSNYKSDNFTIEYDYENYSFFIILEDGREINLVTESLEKAKPAHLNYLMSLLLGKSRLVLKQDSFLLSPLVRRCGTFNTGTNPL